MSFFFNKMIFEDFCIFRVFFVIDLKRSPRRIRLFLSEEMFVGDKCLFRVFVLMDLIMSARRRMFFLFKIVIVWSLRGFSKDSYCSSSSDRMELAEDESVRL
jgi:hypothetical protein